MEINKVNDDIFVYNNQLITEKEKAINEYDEFRSRKNEEVRILTIKLENTEKRAELLDG